jgi:hypothetical protein
MIDWVKKKKENVRSHEYFFFCDVTMYCNTVIAFENKTYLETEKLVIEVYTSRVKRDQAYFVCCEKKNIQVFSIEHILISIKNRITIDFKEYILIKYRKQLLQYGLNSINLMFIIMLPF